MFADTIAAAIGGTKAHARLNDLAQDVWKAWGAGSLSDAEAERLTAMLEAQRGTVRILDTTAVRAPHVPRTIAVSIFPRRRTPMSPDRTASMERRRRLAASGPMPPALAARFTTGELAALRIVADEVRARGACGLTIGEIAARAGISCSTARNGLRAAAREGLLTIEERRRHMQPNLPNLLRIISREWRTWIDRASRLGGGGFKKSESTDRGFYYSGKTGDGPSEKACRTGSVKTRAPFLQTGRKT